MTSWRTLGRISALGFALALALVVGARPGQAGLPVFGSCLVPVQNIPIPDGGNPVIPVIDTLTVPDLGIVADVDVCVEIAHSNVGDLRIQLTHNGLGVLPLLDRPVDGTGSCSGDDIWATFDDDTGAPDPNAMCEAAAPAISGTVSAGTLYVFEDTPAAGDWTLWVRDFSTGAAGKLVDWSLNFTFVTSTPTPSPSPSPTPSPTPTPTPTASPTPTATPTPTAAATPTSVPTPTPGGRTWGDVDCDGDVDSVDALKDLRQVAQLSVQQPAGCPHLGDEVEIDEGTFPWGDGDCDRDLDSVDALKDLREVAELPVSQTEPCPDLGTNVMLKP